MSAKDNKVVVIAVDGSSQAEYATNFYIDHLHRAGDSVVFLHCMEPLTRIGELPSVGEYERVLGASQTRAERCKDKFLALALQRSEQCAVEFVSLYAHRPGEALVAQAKVEGAGLIVTGSRGLGTMRRTILGSVSDYLLHHAHCPVLVCAQRPT